MSYSESFPTQRPIFSLDAANAGRLDPRCSFTRSDTPPTYAAPSAVHYWSNEKHLSSDNVLLQSSTFNLAWSRQGLALPTGGQADPAGGNDGFTLVEDSATNFHRVYQNVTADGKPALTVYAKQNSGSRYLLLTLWNTVNDWECAVFDLAGSAPATASGASSTFTGVTATQTASGGGYYKCVLTGTGTANDWFISLNDASTTSGINAAYGVKSYTGDGSSSIDIAFASLTTTGATDYNATTTQIHREYAPSLKSVATAGQPRFEYSTDGQSMGILVEGSSTNLARYGSAFGTWPTAPRVVVTSNCAIAPNGSLDADVMVTESAAGDHYVYDGSITISSGTVYTASIYAKDAGQRYLQIGGGSTVFGTGQYATFDLQTGSVDANGVTATASSVGNGWFRLTATATATASGTGSFFVAAANSATAARTPSFTGNDYDGLLLYGFQVETGSFASSLVDTGTSGSTATRAAESLSVATADIGYTGGPVSLFCEGTAQGENTGGGQVLLGVHKDDDNRIGVWTRRTNKRIALVSGGGVSSSLEESSWYDGKTALSLTTDSFSGSINGRTVLTDTSQPLPDLNGATVYVGNLDSGTAYQMNGHIKRVALYNEALSDTNLQALTS